MRYILISFFISMLSLPLVAQPFQIVPQPQKTELLQGDGLAFGNLTNLKMTGEFNRPVMGGILTQLTELYVPGSGTLTLRLDSTGIAPESREGYILTISNENAEIISAGEAGLFYGCQTLEQLLEDSRDFNTPVPACKIIDSPALSYRAVQFDVKHHLDHMNIYYESIDRLARYKINAVIFEFEDKLRYRRQPLVAAPQSISIDEMAALTRYARERHIEITPLVQGLGHATFILKHEHYAHLRELPYNRWAFCPMDEGTYDVLFDLYLDAIDATPGSRYLHIGGDEIGNIGLCPRCKPTADEEGILSLNLYWLKRVCEFAKENGRIPIFWDDMPLKEAGVYESMHKTDINFEQATRNWEEGKPILEHLLSDFPKSCVYMRWNYSMAQQPGNIFALDWYQDHGLKAMIATAAQSGPAALFPFDERGKGVSSRGIAAIQSFVQLAAEKGIDGMLCTAWDDRSPHMETYWRGFIASAEYSWSPEGRTLDEYDMAYLQREYGASIPDYTNLYGLLREAALFWEKAFNREKGRMNLDNALFNLSGMAHWLTPEEQKEQKAPEKTDFTDRLIELPDLQNPGSWSKKYAQRLSEAVLIIDDYQRTSIILDSLYHGSKRNRYHWEIFSAINDFQIAAPRLLLALKQCDIDSKARQLAGIEEVRSALAEFDKAWGDLQTVYGKTRFISYPSTYVPDPYHHYASQREDLTWMIQVEELFHQMINSWMDSNQLQKTELLPGKISGWNILSDNEENAREVIDAASEYGINHLQISHHIVHYLREIKQDEKRELCNKLIDYAHEKGISEVVVWDHALYSLDYYPDKFRTGPDSTIDLDNQEFWEWLKNDYRLMLDLIPHADGIILTFIETGARTENQYSEIMKTPAEKLARVIDEIADVVINERELKLYARTFMYTREELSDMLSCIDYIKNEDVLLMVKEVPHDFFLTHPLQTFLDELKRPVIIEFDAGHEYSGQGIIANTFVEKLTERWRFYQQKSNVIGYVARTDRFGDTKIISRPSEILLYAISALNHDPGISDDQIYRDFIGMKYGEEAIDHIKPAFESAYNIVTSSLYTLGLCMGNHSTLSCDYTSTYNRFVSGRWMDNPTVFIEHGINKEFHYYTDIVNHLAPKHLKELDARLFREDPFLLDKSWVQAEELLTREYLDYIIIEKDFGVKLAQKSLKSIEEGKPFIAGQPYADLHNTFYRTLVKAQLSRGAAKAYFAYRLWFADKNSRSQQLLDVFWEGIDEMNQMTNIIQTEFENSPRGGWTWEEDIATVKEYNQLMTGSGWNDYGGIPISSRILESP